MAELTVSIEEAARMLGIGKVLAYKLAKQGAIPILHLGQKRIRVSLPGLRKMIEHAGEEVQN